jgi:hypothetical protein
MYKHAQAFKFLLNQLLSKDSKENASQQSQRSSEAFVQVNQQSMDMTIASFCIVNQSWHCFAELVNTVGLKTALEGLVNQELDSGKQKKPSDYAEETDQMQEYEQILAWVESFKIKNSGQIVL